jgi:hypothetical protein
MLSHETCVTILETLDGNTETCVTPHSNSTVFAPDLTFPHIRILCSCGGDTATKDWSDGWLILMIATIFSVVLMLSKQFCLLLGFK